jgi:hypothetical protein
MEVICKGCDDGTDNVCRTCAQTYIISTNEDPCCMLCKNTWDREFVSKYLTKLFLDTKLKKHRGDLLMERQIYQ